MDFTPRNPNTPDRAIPRFHLRAEKNNFLSNQAGRDIFEDKEFVEIITPGNARSIPTEPVNADHKARWPRQYQAFKDGQELPEVGTPLEQWPILTPATVQNLKALNIRTVEALAGVSDAAIQTMPTGARDFRDKAISWLEAATSNAPLERERARADAADAKAAYLGQQLSELADRMAKLEASRETANAAA